MRCAHHKLPAIDHAPAIEQAGQVICTYGGFCRRPCYILYTQSSSRFQGTYQSRIYTGLLRLVLVVLAGDFKTGRYDEKVHAYPAAEDTIFGADLQILAS